MSSFFTPPCHSTDVKQEEGGLSHSCPVLQGLLTVEISVVAIAMNSIAEDRSLLTLGSDISSVADLSLDVVKSIRLSKFTGVANKAIPIITLLYMC